MTTTSATTPHVPAYDVAPATASSTRWALLGLGAGLAGIVSAVAGGPDGAVP